MDKNILADIGKDKVKNGSMKNHLNDLSNKIFEIVGGTEAEYYGTTSIKDIKKRLDNENEIFNLKFYKYINFKLEECYFVDALNTPEYEEDKIFIFSETPEYKRLYYVAEIIND